MSSAENAEKVRRPAWQERNGRPIYSRALTRDELNEVRQVLADSDKVDISEIKYKYSHITDITDQERDECVNLHFLTNRMIKGRLQLVIIFTLKQPVPEDARRQQAPSFATNVQPRRRKAPAIAPGVSQGTAPGASKAASQPPTSASSQPIVTRLRPAEILPAPPLQSPPPLQSSPPLNADAIAEINSFDHEDAELPADAIYIEEEDYVAASASTPTSTLTPVLAQPPIRSTAPPAKPMAKKTVVAQRTIPTNPTPFVPKILRAPSVIAAKKLAQ